MLFGKLDGLNITHCANAYGPILVIPSGQLISVNALVRSMYAFKSVSLMPVADTSTFALAYSDTSYCPFAVMEISGTVISMTALVPYLNWIVRLHRGVL